MTEMTEQSILLTLLLLVRLDTDCPWTSADAYNNWTAADVDDVSAEMDGCQNICPHITVNDVSAVSIEIKWHQQNIS